MSGEINDETATRRNDKGKIEVIMIVGLGWRRCEADARSEMFDLSCMTNVGLSRVCSLMLAFLL